MIQIGVLLIILGFGSLILETMNKEFRILAWADDMQPAIGIVAGVIGVVLVAGGIFLKMKRESKVTGQQPGVGEWAGDGHWAGSSPSAPQTSGPLTGERASGELQYDVEPTGLGGGQSGRPDQVGASGSTPVGEQPPGARQPGVQPPTGRPARGPGSQGQWRGEPGQEPGAGQSGRPQQESPESDRPQS